MKNSDFIIILEDPKIFELVEEGTDWYLYRNKINKQFVIRDMMNSDTITIEEEDIWDLFEVVQRMVDINDIEIKTFNEKDHN